MSKAKLKAGGAKSPTPQADLEASPAPAKVPPLFRRIDWFTFAFTALCALVGYGLTLAPDLTLEDSGELAVGSYYAGVPHPPGYPVWTLYTWLFTELFPVSNIAFRVAVSSAVAAALACGLIALMVSRGSSMILEGLENLKDLPRKTENGICLVAGFVGGMLMAFNGFMWSQAVIVEVYTLSVLSLVGVLCSLLRWIYAPHQKRYLYLAFFLFGICFTNHQTLVVAAMGIEVLIIAVRPRIGRDLLMANTLVFAAGYFLQRSNAATLMDPESAIWSLFCVIGFLSAIGFMVLTLLTRKTVQDWIDLLRDLFLLAGGGYLLLLFAATAGLLGPGSPMPGGLSKAVHLLGLSSLGLCGWLTWISRPEPIPAAWRGPTLWLGGAALVLALLAPATGNAVFLVHAVLAAGLAALSWYSGRQPAQGGFWLLVGTILVAVFYLMTVLLKSKRGFETVEGFWSIQLAGFLSLGLLTWFAWKTRRLGSDVWVVLACGLMWLLGAAFYFYMPIASMTNPPMNWGYPRTVEGFFHALTRGQYEKVRPTGNLFTYAEQVLLYFRGAKEEFNITYLLMALVPFAFLARLQRRERGWLIGLAAIYVCLAFLLLYLLNPSADMQSMHLNRVFFTSSHVMIAMAIGYGIALLAAWTAARYSQYRWMALIVAAVAAGIGLFDVTLRFHQSEFSLVRFTGVFGFAWALLLVACFLVFQQRPPVAPLLTLLALMPGYSILAHWADNEQRGHLFGYWFGHDMFIPPWEYDPMARDAVLFGGTDPGRFNPTYMIFCESFIPPQKRRNPAFDRRDVYLITQNALADKTYLDYIRAHYNRSTQKDSPFFQELLRTPWERASGYSTNLFSRTVAPLDTFFTELGARIEKDRRERGVYPPEEIHTPTPEESQQAFQEYMDDALLRRQQGRLLPGEQLDLRDGRYTVSGQVSVMAINGLLTRVIFNQNPQHEFYVEESMPLDWMYPHLTPFGIIMKINREPVREFTGELVDRDHRFWTRYSERLIGNWIQYDTSVDTLCDWVERRFIRGDLTDFQGDPKFMRDKNAQKAFSKLRSAIAGLYLWRFYQPSSPEEEKRLAREADFAFRQAFTFCPFSPEAVWRYTEYLLAVNRVDDAIRITETSLRIDKANQNLRNLLDNLLQIRDSPPVVGTYHRVNHLVALGKLDRAARVLREALDLPSMGPSEVGALANAYLKMQQPTLVEPALEKLVLMQPGTAEYRIDLARIQAGIGKTNEAIDTLAGALQVNEERRKTNALTPDLRKVIESDELLKTLRNHPAFQEKIGRGAR